MKKVLLISLMILATCLVGCEEKPKETPVNSNNSQVETGKEATTNSDETQSETNNILVGKTFKISSDSDSELSDCEFLFEDKSISYYDGFSNVYEGNYEINDDIIEIVLLSHNNEYSPSEQSINVKVQLKMLDNDKLEVLKTPDSFILKTSTFGENGWEYDGGEKEMTFNGILQGNQFAKVKSFEERTKEYFTQLSENSGDRTKQSYANVRLLKLDNGNYELVADLEGMIRFEKEGLDNLIKEITDNNLKKKEIPLLNGDKIIIHSVKPDFVVINQGYYDEDWEKASDGEWLDENNLPMFVELYHTDYDYHSPIYLRIEDDGYYYPRYRSIAGVTIDSFAVSTVNEKDAIRIALLPDDKISLDYDDFYGDHPDKKSVEITVEEYYNISPTTIDEDLDVDVNDMSKEFGFEIKDNMIHVIGCSYGP